MWATVCRLSAQLHQEAHYRFVSPSWVGIKAGVKIGHNAIARSGSVVATVDTVWYFLRVGLND
jgi:hypothetical protein